MWIFTCFVFLVMRKHANPWPIHALDAKKYLQKATFLKICEKNTYRVFIKNCVFSFKFCDFSELCQFCCSAGFLPTWCLYTHWYGGKAEKGTSLDYFKIFNNTIFNEHPVYLSSSRHLMRGTAMCASISFLFTTLQYCVNFLKRKQFGKIQIE